MTLPELLKGLRAELQVSNNPDRLAIASLKPNQHGWTAEPYSDEAFEIWGKLRRETINDLQTIHHLAIMHHARAFDLEQSAEPAAADADWKQSLELWHQLHTLPTFWEKLGQQADNDSADFICDIQEELPERLLQIHFDIAADDRSKHYRRRAHIALALNSPFDGKVKDKVRLAAYERWVADLPSTVWSVDTLDPAELQPAIGRIRGYLDLDGDCGPALADLITLLVRLQTAKVQQTNAVGADQRERRQKLDEIRALGAEYHDHVTRLEHVLGLAGVRQGDHRAASVQHQIGERHHDALPKVSRWHSLIGQASQLVDDFEDAAAHYWSALVAARAAGSDQELMDKLERNWATWVALTALNCVEQGKEGHRTAREKLQTIAGTQAIGSLGIFFQARVYFELGDLVAAARAAERAVSIAKFESRAAADSADYRETSIAESDCLRLLRTIQMRPHLDAGEKAMDQGRWAAAVQHFDKAAAIDADDFTVRFFRAQALLQMDEIGRAGADLDAAERIARRGSDGMRDAVKQLRSAYEKSMKRFADYGGMVPYERRQQAIDEANNNNHREAVRLLQIVLRSVPRGPVRTQVEKELSLCLNAVGVQIVNGLNAEVATVVPSSRDRVCRSLKIAEEHLREAVKYDRANHDAWSNLQTVVDLRRNLGCY